MLMDFFSEKYSVEALKQCCKMWHENNEMVINMS